MAQQRFYNATERLLNSFIMGTLKHGGVQIGDSSLGGDVEACAVCIITGSWLWTHFFCMDTERKNIALMVIEKSGYSVEEIFEIERVFEMRKVSGLVDPEQPCSIMKDGEDDDSFKGLCNVFDYLTEIEDCKEEENGADIFELLEAVNN